MARPAGVQLRRWLVLFLCLLIGVNLLAFASSLKVNRSLRALAEDGQALVPSAVSAQLEVSAAENELFQYFAKVADSTEGAVAHLDSLASTLDRLRARPLSKELGAQVGKVQQGADELRRLIGLLPDGSLRGRYRWKLRQDSATAAALGKELEGLTMGLTQAAVGELRSRVDTATERAQAPVWLSAAAIFAGILGVALLPNWWRRFQALILGV